VVNCGTVGDVKDETLDIFAPALHRMTAGRHAVALRSFGGSQCRFASADQTLPKGSALIVSSNLRLKRISPSWTAIKQAAQGVIQYSSCVLVK
jgi:hypothetical protein